MSVEVVGKPVVGSGVSATKPALVWFGDGQVAGHRDRAGGHAAVPGHRERPGDEPS